MLKGMRSRETTVWVAFAAAASLLFLVLGCGGGGVGDGGGVGFTPTFTNVALPDLAGDWQGTFQENLGFVAPHTVSFHLDALGNLTALMVDETAIAVTVTMTEVSDQVFRFTSGDSTFVGTMVVDATVGHIGFVGWLNTDAVDMMDEDIVGVVGKAIPGVPTYGDADLVGNWSGPGVAVDSEYRLVEKWELRVTVDAAMVLSASDSSGGRATGQAFLLIPGGEYGAYSGSAIDSEGLGFTFNILMSPDKSFIALWEGVTSELFPQESSFSFLTKK